jgi:hypothetical protein
MPGTPTSQPPVVTGPTPPQAMPAVGTQAGSPPSNPSNPSVPSMPSMPLVQPMQPTAPMYQGAPTQAAPVASPWTSPSAPPSPPYGVPLPPPKKNRNGLIAAIGGVAAVALVGGGIALFASGGSNGSSGGTSSGGTLGGSGGLALTPIAAGFPLSSLVTDDDAAQYLKATPDAGTPVDNASDDPATYDKTWEVSSAGTELRVQAWNYKKDSSQAADAFRDHTSTLATDAKFEDQGKLGNSDKTEIQISPDPSSGLQHCRIEVVRGGLDVTVTFVESGSAADAHIDVVNLAKLVTGRLPNK